MTISEALGLQAKRLSAFSVTPRLDAEVLLAHTLNVSRAMLLARAQDQLQDDAHSLYERLIERRSHGEPIAYLTGHKEFYGLDLLVTPDVLVPRPETESVVEACLEMLPPDQPATLADIGTGSGAIVVAVAARRPLVTAIGTDISHQAIDVARRNCDRHGVAGRVTLRAGHLLEPLTEPVNVIAANFPYVPPGEASPEVATWEPQVAVAGGGDDGTALIRQFLGAVPRYLLPHGGIVMETAHSQGSIVSDLAKRAFPHASIEVRKDLAGYDRIVVIKT